ncbi:hypothetical protein LUW76_43640 [Actinomadura madurae]|uniref:hypothetical protein n=1 Tax=Actinomadura madurae TaxID=1993 RepID=UPI0020273689|nr:hypothetical protein [Actinomadura madurae]URN00649.1 hypothetical protein LUW76_43640 [Actinomadura madurae]
MADGPLKEPAAGDGLDRGVLAVAGVVVLGAIMSILDVTVVNVAINDLAKEFNTPWRPSSGSRRATRWHWPR